MLQLKNIVKIYKTGETSLTALNGVSINFRKSEFVSILGPSGCGKTTLLNIIGGLDKYTSGDLIIDNRSTKSYNSSNWDHYRNHSIGFVFQSYNLISHQTILSNVELALTLSGVSKSERRKRAIEALKNVGLEEQVNKLPNQLSGGQMQRVAIARALVNDPEILLADEPTGALDSQTSIQIMDLLKEISKTKLVIMVTHNPSLATEYSNRIVKLLDGNIVDDSNPYNDADVKNESTKLLHDKNKSMSFFTALSLSFKNLMTKKGRTILTSFAGSIGIVGIALILSVSTGVNNYIDSVEESTMSSYPLSIERASIDMTSLISKFRDNQSNDTEFIDGYVYTQNYMTTMYDAIYNTVTMNNLSAFKSYIDENIDEIKSYTTDIKYSYNVNLNTYFKDSNSNYRKTYSDYMELYKALAEASGVKIENNNNNSNSNNSLASSTMSIFNEIIGTKEMFEEQFEYVYGHYPTTPNELILIVNDNSQVVDYVLYCIGMMDINILTSYQRDMTLYNEDPDNNPKPTLPPTCVFSYEEICNYEMRVLLDSDYYEVLNNETIKNHVENKENLDSYLIDKLNNTSNILKISGIVKAKDKEGFAGLKMGLFYTSEFETGLIDQINSSDIVNLQSQNDDVNVLLNTPFIKEYTRDNLTEIMMSLSKLKDNETLLSKISPSELIKLQKIALDPTNQANIDFLVSFANKYLLSTKEDVLEEIGYVDYSTPSNISLYPRDFDSKDKIVKFIDDYNESVDDADKLVYSDTIGILLSSVSTIIDAISYVLIAFVSISLIVSSIMIGIITYISVLERTKEIGILRSIGASKKDISRVFNAESITIGFCSGAIGILSSLLLLIPINLILFSLTKLSALKATLPLFGSIALIIVSIILTFIAGLIPSGFAARKDPVIALRSE